MSELLDCLYEGRQVCVIVSALTQDEFAQVVGAVRVKSAA